MPALERGATERWAWPPRRADEAVEALARRSGLSRRGQGLALAAAGDDRRLAGDEAPEPAVGPWIEDLAAGLGLEAEEVEVSYREVSSLVRGCGPALLQIPGGGEPLLLAVLGGGRGRVRVLAPDLRVRHLDLDQVVGALCREVEGPVLPAVDGLLERVRVPRRRRSRARSALLEERLGGIRIRGCWLLRLPPGVSFWRQLRHRGLYRELAKFLGFYAISYLMLLLSWWMLGRGALGGLLSRDWLLAWALVLMSLILPRQLTTWSQSKLAVAAGSLLKRRLLAGSLKLDPDEIRHQGAGQLLGRVIESEAMQTHILLGGSLAVVAVFELALAAWVLRHGAGGWLQVALLAVWTTGVLAFGWRYFKSRLRQTDERLTMTHDLVETMVGHRTRLAQEGRGHWHQREDRLLDSYLAASSRMDAHRLPMALAPMGWTLVGICGLLPAFVAARATVGSLALAVGGVLLAFRAQAKLSSGAGHLMGAWISWQQAAPLFHAAARSQAVRARGIPVTAARDGERQGEPVLEARQVDYRYRQRARPVFAGLDLAIYPGDRLLLEGPSGGGKSTLAAVLTRLRRPDSGLLLLGGLDRYTVEPDVWRRHVVSAPQFHENHVFTETFAFNLLMGRRWPPTREDMVEAETVCRELGLGELLERMPAGLLQLVGETGWQLSHGEKSRLYMARALLQGSEVVILDESFAALDPENLHRCLLCALERAPTLLVIAHP